MAKKPRLGTGKRFDQLTAKLRRKGAETPDALAAWIGRKKLGKKKFQELAAKGRKRKKRKRKRSYSYERREIKGLHKTRAKKGLQ